MSHLLDTCVLSEFQKKQPKQKVIDWLETQLGLEPTSETSIFGNNTALWESLVKGFDLGCWQISSRFSKRNQLYGYNNE